MMEEQNTTPKKRKAQEAPVAHKLIEKRRRDRMNESMEMLKALVPTTQSNQGTKSVKVDLLRMTINHLRDQQMKPASEQKPAVTGPPAKLMVTHRQRGIEDCIQDVRQYLMDVESVGSRDPGLVSLLAHLHAWSCKEAADSGIKRDPMPSPTSTPMGTPNLGFAASSVDSTPDAPPAKRIIGRPSDLLQAAAALSSPSDPPFLSSHEYSSGLDLISSVAQQSGMLSNASGTGQVPGTSATSSASQPSNSVSTLPVYQLPSQGQNQQAASGHPRTLLVVPVPGNSAAEQNASSNNTMVPAQSSVSSTSRIVPLSTDAMYMQSAIQMIESTVQAHAQGNTVSLSMPSSAAASSDAATQTYTVGWPAIVSGSAVGPGLSSIGAPMASQGTNVLQPNPSWPATSKQ